jgi:hypothetical protein
MLLRILRADRVRLPEHRVFTFSLLATNVWYDGDTSRSRFHIWRVNKIYNIKEWLLMQYEVSTIRYVALTFWSVFCSHSTRHLAVSFNDTHGRAYDVVL